MDTNEDEFTRVDEVGPLRISQRAEANGQSLFVTPRREESESFLNFDQAPGPSSSPLLFWSDDDEVRLS